MYAIHEGSAGWESLRDFKLVCILHGSRFSELGETANITNKFLWLPGGIKVTQKVHRYILEGTNWRKQQKRRRASLDMNQISCALRARNSGPCYSNKVPFHPCNTSFDASDASCNLSGVRLSSNNTQSAVISASNIRLRPLEMRVPTRWCEGYP